MANFQIKDLVTDTNPSQSDLFLKSNPDGGLTKVTLTDLKNSINPAEQIKVLSIDDDINTLVTPGKYFVAASTPKNWDTNLFGTYAFLTVEATSTTVSQTIRQEARGLLAMRSNTAALVGSSSWSVMQSGKLIVPHTDGSNTLSFSVKNLGNYSIETFRNIIVLCGNCTFMVTYRGTTGSCVASPLTSNSTITATCSVNSSGTITITASSGIVGACTVVG